MPERTAPTADDLLRHAGWLRRLAERLVGADGADDLVQETWLSALRHRPQQGTGLGPWLRRVLHNRATSNARTRIRRRARETAHAQPEAQPATSDLAARAEATRLLVEAVLRLTPAQRDVILLRFFDEWPPSAIAAQLGLPGATVRSHLARGLARLREDLDAAFDGNRARWTLVLAPLPTALNATTTPLFTALLMTITNKIAAAAIVTALGAGALWWALGDGPAALAPTATPLASAADRLTTAAPDNPVPAAAPEPARAELRTEDRRVAGRLLDADSGEGVPHFALGLVVGAPHNRGQTYEPPIVSERVTTDADGQFRSTREFASGPMHAVLLEDWDRFTSVMQVFGAEPPRPDLAFAHTPGEGVELRLTTGPAFRIDCPQAEAIGVDRFLAMLCDSEVPTGNVATFTHLIAGPSLLARFAPFDRPMRRARADKLHLLSTDGSWDGWTTVEPRAGTIGGPVSIELFACGRLDLTVRADTPPQPEEVRVALYRGALAASQLPASTPLWERMTGGALATGAQDEPLRFVVGHQRTGTYTVHVRSRGFDDHLEVIELRQGNDNDRVLTLVRAAAADRTIAGFLQPRSGRRPGVELVAWLQSTDGDAGSERMAPIEWTEQAGRWRGRFAFDGLLDDEYRVWINNGPRVPRPAPRPVTLPEEFRVHADGSELAFELADEAVTTVVEVRVSERATGAELDAFTVLALLSPPHDQPPTHAEGGRAQLTLTGDLHDARLLVHAAGYTPTFAELPATGDADGVRRVTVGVDRGWGAAVQVLTIADGKAAPLAGAAVLADGIEAARSDDRGIALLQLAVRPAILDVRLSDHTIERRRGAIDAQGRLQEPSAAEDLETFGFVLHR